MRSGPKYCYIGPMNNQTKMEPKVQDLTDSNREQIEKWLINDLKRIQALCGMLQDPVLKDLLVTHIEGMMLNDQNRKRMEVNGKEDTNA